MLIRAYTNIEVWRQLPSVGVTTAGLFMPLYETLQLIVMLHSPKEYSPSAVQYARTFT